MNRLPEFAAAVVAWNGGERLDRCVSSLLAARCPRIVLVDNGSGPEERARLQGRYGSRAEVQLVFLRENAGFAGGANAAFRAVLRAGFPAVLLGTQDVVFEPEAPRRLAAAIASDSRVGIAGPCVLDQRRGGAELSRGERVILPLLCLPRRWLRYRSGGDAPYPVSGLMGCALMLSADLLRATGGFDADFFAYYEEIDLCLRARRLGFRVVCVPAARVWHDGMRGFLSGFTPAAAELKARNLAYLMRKHGSVLDWAAFLPAYAGLLGISAARYASVGRWDVCAALVRGARAGIAGRVGPVPTLAGAS